MDGQYSDYKFVLSGVPQGSVLGPLLFILYTADMWLGLENKLMAYADDTTLYSAIRSPRDRLAVANSLNEDLAKIQLWCDRWGMKLNPNKTQSIIVSRLRTVDPVHPDLLLRCAPIKVASSLRLLGVTIDNKVSFGKYIRTLASSISQKTGLLRKCYRCFRDSEIIKTSFFAFILPCFEYCSVIWMSAADSHLRLLERALGSIRFLLPDLIVDLHNRREISGLCLLFKIFNSENHPMKFKLPPPFAPGRVTRFVERLNSQSFRHLCCNTNQFSRCFIPHFSTKWNHLPDDIVHSSNIYEFKTAIRNYMAVHY